MLIIYWSTSCYPAPVSQLANYISLQNVLTNHKQTIRKLRILKEVDKFSINEFINLRNELIKYFINTSVATAVIRVKKVFGNHVISNCQENYFMADYPSLLG